MKLEDKWSWRRFGMMLVMMAATVGMTIGVWGFQKQSRGEWLIAALSGAVFSILLILYLERERRIKGIYDEKANNYVRIGLAYGVCCLLTVGMSFLPEYSRPVTLAAILMAMASTSYGGLLVGCYCSLTLCLAVGGNVYLFACYLLLCICGSMIAGDTQRKKNRIWSQWMILTVTVCCTELFALIDFGGFRWQALLQGIAGGLLSCLGLALLFWLWDDKIEDGRKNLLDKLVEETYELSRMMESFSKADYQHARKVSRIAAGCAKALGADEKLAAAAGLYYRVGRLEGEPYVENGIAMARKHKFPPELLRILGEYNGEKHLPTTVESALVHIIDTVVAKFEVLDQSVLSESWNHDMIIYQTLNENSAQGLYDKSGLSMNMFLMIRSYLIEEAGLYDGYSGK